MSEAAVFEAAVESGLGPMLCAAREARGLTQQGAAEQLNLDVTVVQALEREDFAALGAPVFAKGHLRRYGGMLGIPEERLLDAYGHAQVQPETPTLVPRARQEMMPVRGRPKWPWVVGGAVTFLVAAGIAAYVSEYGLHWPGATSTTDSAVPQGAEAETPSSAPAGPATSGASAQGGPAVAAVPTLPLPQGHVSVHLTFAADSWAEVYDGSGKAVLYDLGRAGTQRAITAAAPLSLTVGNPAAVSLLVNGRPTALPAVPEGQSVARFRIEADGSLH